MMKRVITILFLIFTNLIFGQTTITVGSSKIKYATPDSKKWEVGVEYSNKDSSGVKWYHHKVIPGDKYPKSTLMYITYQYNLSRFKDVNDYSTNCIQETYGKNGFIIKSLGTYPEYSSDKHSLIFKIESEKDGTKWFGIIGYIYSNSIGIEILTSAKENAFLKLEDEMAQFVKSVHVETS